MEQNINPLQQYFRRPSIYIRLPSKGNYWAQNSIVMPANGEIPVFPMNAIDEITYRTPDALFNGQATVDVVQSCVPNIKDAWQMPGCDLNSIIIAIRIASYGHDMETSSICPKCNETSNYTFDLRNFLDTLTIPDYSKPIIVDELKIITRPLTFQEQNSISLSNFENQKMLDQITSSELPEEEKIKTIFGIMKKIAILNTKTVSMNIAAISKPSEVITNREFIESYVNNCTSQEFNIIRDAVLALRNESEPKPVTIDCSNCNHNYKQDISFENSSFFGHAS